MGWERRKLPVFKTIWLAYREFIRNFFEVVRMSWFPLLIISVFISATIFGFRGQLMEMNEQQFSDDSSLFFGLSYLGACFTLSVLIIGLARVFLDEPRSTSWIYFSIGLPELLHFVATFVIYGALGVGLIYIIPHTPSVKSDFFVFVVVANIIVFNAVFFSLSALIPGINVRERHLGILRALKRMWGNYSRVLIASSSFLVTLYIPFALLFFKPILIPDLFSLTEPIEQIIRKVFGQEVSLDQYAFGVISIGYFFFLYAVMVSFFSQVYLALTPNHKRKAGVISVDE